MLESPERMVYCCLDLFPKGIDELMKETELSISELMERLITLELKGYAEEVSKLLYKAAVKIQPLLWRKLWHAIW